MLKINDWTIITGEQHEAYINPETNRIIVIRSSTVVARFWPNGTEQITVSNEGSNSLYIDPDNKRVTVGLPIS